jgi:dTDP-4-dehydrorhamnose reductase
VYKRQVKAISINSLLPQKLAKLCRIHDARLIHVSTDCVFSGKKGMYTEHDYPDAVDLYGRTKYLGEVEGHCCLTLRTSIIGRELNSRNGLVEWFLNCKDATVQGFRNAIYTGLTTIELARVIEMVMLSEKKITGVYHVSSNPINKYDLILKIKDAYGIIKEVLPVAVPAIDRSLDSNRFRQEMNYTPPTWDDMLFEMAADLTPYSFWQSQCATGHY